MTDIQKQIKSYFPFEFSPEQDQAVEDIRQDLASGKQMSRLLHADVGAGKSAVAFAVAMGCAAQDKRTLILAPTTILADQHYRTLKGMGWDDVRQHTPGEALVQSAHVIIGTHSLLHDEPILKSASLVIIDEFQKFGVLQRKQITKHNPHLLLMSATPVPRSLAMTVFGDLDISVIRELPIKRGTIITRWITP